MTNKRYFLIVGILALIGLVGISCSPSNNYPLTPTSVIEASAIPSITPSPTLITLSLPTSPATIPYPTASTVKASAVAFISGNSLWIANVDGSGERKVVDIEKNESRSSNYFLRWSPDGKLISYISNGELWVISPDGRNKERILPESNKSKRLISYNWHPDGLQLAYTQVDLCDANICSESVGVLNLKTRDIYRVSTYESQSYGTIVRWSPNGQYLVFNREASFIVFDMKEREVAKEIMTDYIGSGCSARDNTAPVWSPNNEWFFHYHGSSSGYGYFWACICSLDGSNHLLQFDETISTPVWDKTGNFLYFVARKANPHGDPDLKIDEWLIRYDVRAQKTEYLLKLRNIQTYDFTGQVSISPDGSTLGVHTQNVENNVSYILVDLKTFSIKNLDLENFCMWSADSENFICLKQSGTYSTFSKFNIQTNEATAFSGEHIVDAWVTSPIAPTP